MRSARLAPQTFRTPTSRERRTERAVERLTKTTHAVNRIQSNCTNHCQPGLHPGIEALEEVYAIDANESHRHRHAGESRVGAREKAVYRSLQTIDRSFRSQPHVGPATQQHRAPACDLRCITVAFAQP